MRSVPAPETPRGPLRTSPDVHVYGRMVREQQVVAHAPGVRSPMGLLRSEPPYENMIDTRGRRSSESPIRAAQIFERAGHPHAHVEVAAEEHRFRGPGHPVHEDGRP